MPASVSITAARSLASLCVNMQRLQRARLPHCVLASEQQFRVAADRVADVLELEAIRVGVLDLDAADVAVAVQLDHRLVAMPRVVEEQRSLAADRLERV